MACTLDGCTSASICPCSLARSCHYCCLSLSKEVVISVPLLRILCAEVTFFQTWESSSRWDLTLRPVYIATIVASVGVLSIQPHQEPRFLVPLIIPAVLLAADVLGAPAARTRTRARFLRKLFWVSLLSHTSSIESEALTDFWN
jgi:hypothetical protein